MNKFKIIIAMVLLVASIFLLFSFLFYPQPIKIVLETGQEVTTNSPNYFSIATVLILIISAFIIGIASMYLFYNADTMSIFTVPKQEKHDADYRLVLPLLKPEERKVVSALIENNGSMLQNALVLKLELSKVKITRILASLQNKQIVIKERHGLTNNIKLKPK